LDVAKTAKKIVETSSDGRRQRTAYSRQRIVAAMLDLAREGQITPSAEAVADRAGVGRRTVFRLFSDMESLYREMHIMVLARIEHIRASPIQGETWRARLERLVERRAMLFEEILPIKTAADAQRHRSEFLQTAHAETVRTLRNLMLFVLPKALKEDADRVEALDALLSLDMWRRLRTDQKLTQKAALRVLQTAVEALVK
jgi:AcrR family transcriptional regulator